MIQKFISKLSEKEKKIFYLTVVVVLLALLDRLFLGPVLSRLKSLDEEIRYQENSIRRDLRFLSYKDRILAEKEALKSFYARKKLTQEETIAVFLKKIEMLASDAKITLIKVTPLEREQKKGYLEYYASLDSIGKLKDIATFIHLVDSSKDLLKVIKMNINAKKASSEDINASITIAKIIVDPPASDQDEPDVDQNSTEKPAEVSEPAESVAAESVAGEAAEKKNKEAQVGEQNAATDENKEK